MRQKRRVVEVLAEFRRHKYKIRIWGSPSHSTERTTAAKSIVDAVIKQEGSDFDIAYAIADLKGVNAVQVKHKDWIEAVVVYNDWP